MFIVSYVWLGAVGTIVVGELKPEFSMVKRIVLSAVSISHSDFALDLLGWGSLSNAKRRLPQFFQSFFS